MSILAHHMHAAVLAAPALTWNEALSGVFGTISLVSWIFLLVPQLVENWRQKSAEGISLTFLLIWFVGDLTNLAGALLARLVPTVTAIAIYFCFADAILISQCLYYNSLNRRARAAAAASGPSDERAPLLTSPAGAAPSPKQPAHPQRRLTDITEENIGLPGSRRRSSAGAASRRRSTLSDARRPLPDIAEDPRGRRTTAIARNAASIVGIVVAGAAAWAVAWQVGWWRPTPVGGGHGDGPDHHPTPVAAEVLGYASALLYLGARVPQIIKNQRDRSCDGLSLLFFILSLIGNATYGAGILFHSVERTYFLTNLPWLIGSLGTMAEDVAIFVQFSVFGEKHADSAVQHTQDD